MPDDADDEEAARGVLVWSPKAESAELANDNNSNNGSKSNTNGADDEDMPHFIVDAQALKKIFSLPLSDGPTTIAIHRVGSTLLLDSSVEEGSSAPGEVVEWPDSPPKSTPLLNRTHDRVCRLLEEAVAGGNRWEEVEKGLLLLKEDNEEDDLRKHEDDVPAQLEEEEGFPESKSCEPPPEDDDEEQEEKNLRMIKIGGGGGSAESDLAAVVAGSLAPRLLLDESEQEKRFFPFELRAPPRSYARVLEWKLRELRILSGSDVMICCCSDTGQQDATRDRPEAATLQLTAQRTLGEPDSVRRLAVLDYWLENLVAGVPKLALCLESKGVVVGGRLVETASIPSALDASESTKTRKPLFEPRGVELHASALLRFLQANCTEDGGSYVLRRAGDESLRLFDVSLLSDRSQRKWKWLLATLAARFATRLHQHLAVAPGSANQLTKQATAKLRARQKDLLETALALLGELEDLGGASHYSMRCALERQLAAAGLEQAVEKREEAEKLSSFFGDETKEQEEEEDDETQVFVKALDRLVRIMPTLALENARLRLEEAVRYGKLERDLYPTVGRLADRLDSTYSECLLTTLALARRQLEEKRPSNLMHDLKRAASLVASAVLNNKHGEEHKLVVGAIWHAAASFCRGVDLDRFAWSDRGAHEADATALLRELDDLLPTISTEDELPRGAFACSGLVGPGQHTVEATLAALALTALGDGAAREALPQKDARFLLAATRRFTARPTDDEGKKEEEEEDSPALEPKLALLVCRASALHRCLSILGGRDSNKTSNIKKHKKKKKKKKSSALSRAVSRRLGDACNALGARLLLIPCISPAPSRGASTMDLGRVALLLALARLDRDEDKENVAMVRLNLSLIERRSVSQDNFETALAEAQRHCEAAASALDDRVSSLFLDHRDEDAASYLSGALNKVQLELASTQLMLGIQRRRRDFGGEVEQEEEEEEEDVVALRESQVLEPLEAALRGFEKAAAGEGGHLGAHYQVGSFLVSRLIGRRRRRRQRRSQSAIVAEETLILVELLRATEHLSRANEGFDISNNAGARILSGLSRARGLEELQMAQWCQQQHDADDDDDGRSALAGLVEVIHCVEATKILEKKDAEYQLPPALTALDTALLRLVRLLVLALRRRGKQTPEPLKRAYATLLRQNSNNTTDNNAGLYSRRSETLETLNGIIAPLLASRVPPPPPPPPPEEH